MSANMRIVIRRRNAIALNMFQTSGRPVGAVLTRINVLISSCVTGFGGGASSEENMDPIIPNG